MGIICYIYSKKSDKARRDGTTWFCTIKLIYPATGKYLWHVLIPKPHPGIAWESISWYRFKPYKGLFY